MKERRNPHDKKALAYRKDRFPDAEYPHAFRLGWPRKKAGANRAYRHRIHQVLGQVKDVPADEIDHTGADRVRAVRRRVVRKWGTSSLGERVQRRHWRRIYTTGWNFFKEPYASERHRLRFVAFLDSLTEGSTSYSRDVAIFFRDLLDAQHAPPRVHFRDVEARGRPWLRAFLRDAPEWSPRLQAWIARLTE